MKYLIACQDLENDCDKVIEAKNAKELMKKLAKHVNDEHMIKEEQLREPNMIRKIKSSIKIEY
jgi:predicted small metal-binding protein